MIISPKEYYKLLVRTTVVVTTISRRGISNAAPFSFNTPVSFNPPIIVIASSPEHDTWRNIKENREFVVNIIGEDLSDKIKILERDYPYEVSEIKEAGLTEAKSKTVKPPRIKEALAWIECRMIANHKIGDHILIAGEVLHVEVKDEYFDGKFDVEKAKPLLHIAGELFAIPLARKVERAR